LPLQLENIYYQTRIILHIDRMVPGKPQRNGAQPVEWRAIKQNWGK